MAIVRRIDSSGDGLLQFHEFKFLCEPVIVKNIDILEVEDEGKFIKPRGEIDERYAGPLLR